MNSQETELTQEFEAECPEHMSTGVVADYCGVSNATVLRWIGKSHLAAFRLPDGHYRIQREDFADFLDRYQIPPHRRVLNKKSRGRTSSKSRGIY